jgi:Uma2 family endonuclease
MDALSEIQQAIGTLSRSQRYQLTMWMHDLRDVEMDALRVAEGSLAYDEAPRYMTVDEYLAFELGNPIRHEFVAGEVFAMCGVSLQHNRITTRMLVTIANSLRGGPCQAYMSDVKVRLKVNTREHFYYPDLMVVCDHDGQGHGQASGGASDHDSDSTHFVRNPKLIVEVLSPSTEAIDRREKWLAYRQIATLDEYVLVAQDECEVTIYRRHHDWRPIVLNSLDGVAEFRSIKLSLPLAHIYHDSPAVGGR